MYGVPLPLEQYVGLIQVCVQACNCREFLNPAPDQEEHPHPSVGVAVNDDDLSRLLKAELVHDQTNP